jgi:hypothetical protein
MPTETVLLGAWRTSRLAYEFDRQTGRYSRRLVRLGISLPISGFGAIERTREHGRVFFCIYRWNAGLVFQAGTRAWRLDRGDLAWSYRQLDGGRSSEFSISEGGQLVYRCTYRHWLRAVRAHATVSSDNIDFEQAHFLAHVAGRSLPAADFDGWQDASATQDPAAD